MCSRRNYIGQDESFIIVVDEWRFDLSNSLNVMIGGSEPIHAHKQALIVEEESHVVRVLDVILHYAFLNTFVLLCTFTFRVECGLLRCIDEKGVTFCS